MSSVTLATSEEKSVDFWAIDSRTTVTPSVSHVAVAESARPVEYEVWSSTTSTFVAPIVSLTKLAIVGPWASSLGTTRANVGILPSTVRLVRVADGET